MNPGEAKSSDRARLAGIARQAMIERGLEPDFPPAAQQQLGTIGGPAGATNDARDMRDWLWASIDNDDSPDLDQLTVAEALAGGRVRILVAIAGVDAPVRDGWMAQARRPGGLWRLRVSTRTCASRTASHSGSWR